MYSKETSCGGQEQEQEQGQEYQQVTTRTRIKNKLLRKQKREKCGIDREVFYRTIRPSIPDAKGSTYR